jgi:hypothetical protein
MGAPGQAHGDGSGLNNCDGGSSIPGGPLREALDEVLTAAEGYLGNPTEETHAALTVLNEASRDQPYSE